MSLFDEIRRRARHVLQPLLALGLLGYFGFHAVHGERGALALIDLRAELAVAEAARAEAARERAAWETRVRALRSSSLDPDLLEERARALLNASQHRDVIVLAPETSLNGLAQR